MKIDIETCPLILRPDLSSSDAKRSLGKIIRPTYQNHSLSVLIKKDESNSIKESNTLKRAISMRTVSFEHPKQMSN